jgi:biopolymer transport protein TolQ
MIAEMSFIFSGLAQAAPLKARAAVAHVDLVTQFFNQGLVGPAIMGLLIVVSVVCWAIIFSRGRVILRARNETGKFLDIFWKSTSLSAAFNQTKDLVHSPLGTLFRLGYSELQKLKKVAPSAENGLRPPAGQTLVGLDNIRRALARAQGAESTRLGKSITFLATTAYSGPLIGLFGTIWGIMGSFQEIGQKATADLATVAPGISVALITTAGGLMAAIPAVVAYNYFLRKIQVLEAEMDSFTADFLNIIERDVLRRAHTTLLREGGLPGTQPSPITSQASLPAAAAGTSGAPTPKD